MLPIIGSSIILSVGIILSILALLIDCLVLIRLFKRRHSVFRNDRSEKLNEIYKEVNK